MKAELATWLFMIAALVCGVIASHYLTDGPPGAGLAMAGMMVVFVVLMLFVERHIP